MIKLMSSMVAFYVGILILIILIRSGVITNLLFVDLIGLTLIITTPIAVGIGFICLFISIYNDYHTKDISEK